jgi:hypothetical protein
LAAPSPLSTSGSGEPSIFSVLESIWPASQLPLPGSTTEPPIVALTATPLLRTRAKEALSLSPGPPLKVSPSQGWPPIIRSSPGPPIMLAAPESLRGWKRLTP